MKTEITLCDLCQTPLENPNLKRPMNGAGLQLGYSLGGWGHRQDFVCWSGEICETCFAEYETIAKAVELWLKKRAGTRAPKIIILEHGVSVVTADDPNSEPKPKPLLTP